MVQHVGAIGVAHQESVVRRRLGLKAEAAAVEAGASGGVAGGGGRTGTDPSCEEMGLSPPIGRKKFHV